jgi:hypothetical protein
MKHAVTLAGLALLSLSISLSFGATANAAAPGGGMYGCSVGDLQGAAESACLDQNSGSLINDTGSWHIECDADGTHSCCHSQTVNGKSVTTCEALSSIKAPKGGPPMSHIPSTVLKSKAN